MFTKIIFSFLFILIALIGYGKKEPLVLTNTKDILIKHDDYIINWHLDSSKNPDTYSIANDLKSKAITIITDIDSFSFTILPGEAKDFVIKLNDTEDYNTQISMLPNPIFFNPKVYLSFFVLLIAILSFLVIKRRTLPITRLLKFGAISGLLFWIMTFVGGLLHGSYSHITMGVSELGTISKGSEKFMAMLTMLLSIFCFLFSIGFVKASKALKINLLPSVLSFTMSISMAWGAVFPSGNVYHGLLGPLPLGIMIGSLVAALFWKKTDTYAPIRKWSLISFCVMLLFIVRFIPNLQQQFEGVIQRTLWFGWSIWFVALSYYLPKLYQSEIKIYQKQMV